MMRVNEIFGPTFQGEGPHIGMRCVFLRLAECNLSCSWCDTPYTWDWDNWDRTKESRQMSCSEVCEELLTIDAPRIVITGGEPMMQQRFFPQIAEDTGRLLDVETNGTVMPHPDYRDSVDLYVVSPKLAHSGDTEFLRIKPAVLKEFAGLTWIGAAAFKFVIQSAEDISTVQKLVDENRIDPEAVYLMPEGVTRERQQEAMIALSDDVLASGFNLSPRLHVLLWNDKRGV